MRQYSHRFLSCQDLFTDGILSKMKRGRETDEERLRWLFEVFPQHPLSRASDRDWRHLWGRLNAIAEERPALAADVTPDRDQQRDVQDAQKTIADMAAALAAREHYEFKDKGGIWTLEIHGPRMVSGYTGRLSVMLLHAAKNLLGRVGPGKLMACPFQRRDDSKPCGKVFIARRRQKFCGREHAAAAAFQRYLQEHGGIRPDRQRRRR
jgi:hypothetical protein